MKKIILKTIKKMKSKCIFLKVIVCAMVILFTNLLPLQIIAESNQNDVKANTLEVCPLGEELVKPVTQIKSGTNVTFSNIAFAGDLKEAVFNGMTQLENISTGWPLFPGENHRLMYADNRLFALGIYDTILINKTSLAAGIKLDTLIGEVYAVSIPYDFVFNDATGDEYQNFLYELFNSNQLSLKKGSIPLTKDGQTGTVNFTFIGTGTTVGLAFGLESTSQLKKHKDMRIVSFNPSVKMVKQIQQIFPDINLAQAVAAKLGKQITDYVTKEELESVQDLTAINKSIQDLSGMQCLTKIKDINFSTNQISDLSPLAGLTNLTNLRIDHNHISDLSPLIGLNQLTNLNLVNQSIQLEQGTIRVPTLISISNPNGSIPPIVWIQGTGTYENSNLIWSTPGNNQLTWSNYVTIGNAGSVFNGKVSQTNKGFLSFKQVPDSINFQTTTIPSKETIIQRDDSNWEMSVYDELPGREWHITATIDSPLTSTSNSSHQLLEALVYVDDKGNTTPLSKTPLNVFEYTTGAESIIPINWEANKGILLKINPNEVYAESYITTINWTLSDAP
ncbi:internalin N-terminal domain-containing protein [Gottfriedia sp. OAE603]|uniref:internalin N-terminal domain-containing protein n=1 Tax=Gottfriedia sp. OAE603 TaxID=2663872 RepID=UPI001789C764